MDDRKTNLFSWIGAIIATALCAYFTWTVWVWFPWFEASCRGMREEITPISILFLKIGRGGLVGTFALLGVLALAKEFFIRKPVMRLCLSLLGIIASTVVFQIYKVAMAENAVFVLKHFRCD